MAGRVTTDGVFVSARSVESDDPFHILQSNISFLSALLEQHLREDELAPDALRSYYVDYYLTQVNDGGFSQFIFNTRWHPPTIEHVGEGLTAIGALRHLELFDEVVEAVDRFGPTRLAEFFDSDYFDENVEHDFFGEFDDPFFELCESEDLVELNADWLRRHPRLIVKSSSELEEEVARRVAAITDMDERIAAELASEPRFLQLIRALCDATGQQLNHVTACDPNQTLGRETVLAWHFVTDRGRHYLVDRGERAIMFSESNEQIAAIDAPASDYGEL